MNEEERKEVERALKIGFYRIFGGDVDSMVVAIGNPNKYGVFSFVVGGPILADDGCASIAARSSIKLCKKVDDGYAPWLTNKGELY